MGNVDTSLYDSDFYLWTQQAAESLRSGVLASDDLEHAAEEIADMGKRDRRELESRMMALVMHLIKWAAQPQMRETSTWLATINEQRTQIEGVLAQSPSLQIGIPHDGAGHAPDQVGGSAPDARNVNVVGHDQRAAHPN